MSFEIAAHLIRELEDRVEELARHSPAWEWLTVEQTAELLGVTPRRPIRRYRALQGARAGGGRGRDTGHSLEVLLGTYVKAHRTRSSATRGTTRSSSSVFA